MALERAMRGGLAIFLLLLGGFTSSAKSPGYTDGYLDTDNIRMIALLRGLNDRHAGEKFEGLTLQDGTLTLKDAIFLGSFVDPARQQHVYTFRAEGRENSYVWVEPKGVPLAIPPKPKNVYQEFAFTLGGDAYKFPEVRPGAGVIVLPGGNVKWLKKLRADSKKWP